ncbi:hypothetical protein BDC45DRAFT_181746 [Circinella umbellata]|nr:hypothetical protein BDC45DRAFT_181746 [Circinella umbellata]
MNEINISNYNNMDHKIDEFRNAANQLVQQIGHINNDNEFKSYSTTILRILGDAQQSIHVALAVRISQRHDFTRTINDDAVAKTTMIIKDAPITKSKYKLSLQNYLTIGEVYIFESRYKDAILTYEKGIRDLLPSEWPLLYMKRQEAKETMDRKRIDFITRLPLEIAAYIFDYLAAIIKQKDHDHEFDLTLMECTCVSHGWRTVLLGRKYVTKKVWTTAVFFGAKELPMMNSTGKLLPTVGKNVQELKFCRAQEHQIKNVVELAYAGRLPYLKELSFLLHSEYNDMTSHKRCISLITHCYNNLVSLEINIPYTRHQEIHSPFCLDAVLATCLNLKELNILSKNTNVSFNPTTVSLDSNIKFSLTSLSVAIANDNMSSLLLEKLIPYCPHLKILITSSTSPDVLNLLNHHCLRLEHLLVHPVIDLLYKSRPDFHHVMSSYSNSNNNCTTITPSSSLQTINFQGQSITHEYAESLLALFLKGQHTIKYINLDFNKAKLQTPDGIYYLWNILTNHPRLGPSELFTQLTTLKIKYAYTRSPSEEEARFIASIEAFITQHCRLLETLS